MQAMTTQRLASVFGDALLFRQLTPVRRLLSRFWSPADTSEAMSSGAGRAKKGKILFIQPQMNACYCDNQTSAPYAGYRYFSPPLGILTIAGCIPREYDVEIRDENVRPVEYPTDADIVAITGSILGNSHIERVKRLSGYFRRQGKLICLGGPVANLKPEAVRPYCDVLFEGEGELTWPQFLRDYEIGAYSDSYQQSELIDLSQSPVPRIDLINVADYAIGSVQTTRGCPFTCEFCDIIVVYGRKVRKKPIPQVLREIELWADAGQQCILFSDDNFVGHRPYVKELLRELIRFNAGRKYPCYFFSEASVDMAKDRELLELLRDANFFCMYVGIESPRKESLTETHKVQNVHTDDLVSAVHTIQSYGLFLSGGMIVGFDHDDKEIFDEQYEFLQRSGLLLPQLNVLRAMPKTPLYERMKVAGRLLTSSADLITNIKPVGMTYDELKEGYFGLLRRVYDHDAFLQRYLQTISCMRGHKFSNDRVRLRWRQTLGILRMLSYYLLAADAKTRRFFLRMLVGTMQVNPHAWRWTLRMLVTFIHVHNYSQVEAHEADIPVGFNVEGSEVEPVSIGSA